MRSLRSIGTLAALMLGVPLAAHAQVSIRDKIAAMRIPTTQQDQNARDRNGHDKVPPGQLPPAGMCRIWIDGVPPGRQPAPTDCQTAVATRPANARVIWGDQSAFPGKGKGKANRTERRDDRNVGSMRGRGHDDDGDDDRNDDRNGARSGNRTVNGIALPSRELDRDKANSGKLNRDNGKAKGKLKKHGHG